MHAPKFNTGIEIDHRMAELSSALDICLPLLQGKLLYLDYPVHGNVGDLLIWMGARQFLKRHKKNVLGQFSINNTGRRARHLLDKCSTIIFHGGGNFGDLWPGPQDMREQIVQQYPHKRIVVFPQTVHFDDPRKLDESCAILSKHPDLHMFFRDKRSLTLIQERELPNVALCPDMAHALWNVIHPASSQNNPSPLYLLRRDKEDLPLPPDVMSMRGKSSDWDDLLKGLARHIYRLGVHINKTDGRKKVGNLLPAYSAWSATSKLLIHRAVNLFSPHDTIVTNRLHAIILASLLRKKVVAFDNSYGKLSSYIDCWLADCPSIELRKIVG